MFHVDSADLIKSTQNINFKLNLQNLRETKIIFNLWLTFFTHLFVSKSSGKNHLYTLIY